MRGMDGRREQVTGFCGFHPFRKGRGMDGAPGIYGGAGESKDGEPPDQPQLMLIWLKREP